MRRALHAEWTKLRTMPDTAWLLLGTVVVTVAVSAVVSLAADVRHCPSVTTCMEDLPRLGLTGVRAAQVVVMVFAVLAVSNEYGTHLIQVTLTARPQRLVVLLSKLLVIAAAATAAAMAGVLGAFAAARTILPRQGFTEANGYPRLSTADGPTLRATAGSILYLVLVAVLCAAIAVVLRDAAAALVVASATLFASPVISVFVTDPKWLDRLQRYAPMDAGLTVQATRDVAHLPITPWGGLGVLAAYAFGACAVGAVALCRRDA